MVPVLDEKGMNLSGHATESAEPLEFTVGGLSLLGIHLCLHLRVAAPQSASAPAPPSSVLSRAGGTRGGQGQALHPAVLCGRPHRLRADQLTAEAVVRAEAPARGPMFDDGVQIGAAVEEHLHQLDLASKHRRVKSGVPGLGGVRIRALLEQVDPKRPVPAWLSLDVSDMTGRVVSLPADEDLITTINSRLIVEFYSR